MYLIFRGYMLMSTQTCSVGSNLKNELRQKKEIFITDIIFILIYSAPHVVQWLASWISNPC